MATLHLPTNLQAFTIAKRRELESYVAKWMAHRVREKQSKTNVPQMLLGRRRIKFAKKWARDSAMGKRN